MRQKFGAMPMICVLSVCGGCGDPYQRPRDMTDELSQHPFAERDFSDRCDLASPGPMPSEADDGWTIYHEALRSVAVLSFSNRSVCSAVLIRPDRLITAAHCFDSGSLLLSVDFADQLSESPTVIRVSKIRIHPTYQTALQSGLTIRERADLASYDVAVVHLRQKVVDRHPVDFAGSGLVRSGQVLAIAAAGDAGNGSKKKRLTATHAGVQIGRLEIGHLLFRNLILLDSGSGSGACPGDSGGGIFIRRHWRMQLVGVVSGMNNALYPGFPVSTCQSCARGLGVVTILNPHRDFILDE